MPSPEPKPLRDFYEKGQVLLEEARSCSDPDMKQQLYKAADRYFKADIDLVVAKETGNNKIGDIMAAEAPPQRPSNDAGHGPAQRDPTSAFFGFLEQALTIGARGIRRSALPTFIGYLVYAALAALFFAGILLDRPQVTAAAIVLLLIVGLLAVLLLFDLPKKVRPIVAEIILVMVVVSVLGVAAYAVVKLLNPIAKTSDSGTPAEGPEKKQIPIDPGVLRPTTTAPEKKLPATTQDSSQDNIKPGSSDYDEGVLKQYAGDEGMLAKLGEKAFARQDYTWTIRFLEQARTVQSSKVWERDYPYLAAAYLLANGDRARFESTLQEMLAEMRLNNSYLHFAAPIGMALRNLSDVRQYLDKPAQDYIDNQIVPAAIKIKNNV